MHPPPPAHGPGPVLDAHGAGRRDVRALPRPRAGGAVIALIVKGHPAPKGSRTVGHRKDGTHYTRPASSSEHGWIEAVAQTAMWRASQADELPEPPYEVTLSFYVERPKRPKYPWPTRGDADKLARAVIDGLVRGGVLTDDRHVVRIVADKQYATAPGGECCRVEVGRAASVT